MNTPQLVTAAEVRAGQVLIGPDQARHTITEVTHEWQLEIHRFTTDTGVHVEYRQNALAREATYEIERTTP